MPHYTLHYFDSAGRAEIIRLLLHQAGVPFEDKRYTREEWENIKDDATKFPFGMLPVLEIDGKTYLAETNAIARYVANEHGLAGKTNLDKAICDSYVSALRSLSEDFIHSVHQEQDEEKKKEKKELFLSTSVPEALAKFENLFKQQNGGKAFLVGDEVTWADILIMAVADGLQDQGFDKVPLLKALVERVRNLPRIKEYREERAKK